MFLLRHGQSEFNVHYSATKQDPGIVDPGLTALGKQQAAAAADELAGAGIRRILTSPYTRALQTAAVVARRLSVPLTVTTRVRERFAFTCDIGTPASALHRCWPGLDFSELDEVWWPDAVEPVESVVERAARFRAGLDALPDWEHTLVVSHWGFLLALSGTSLANGSWQRLDPDRPVTTPVWKH